MFMIFKFNDWLEIDKTDSVESVMEFMENYISHYQAAFDKIYKSSMKPEKLIVKMVLYLKTRGIGKKFALPYLAYDIATWLENVKGFEKIY